MQKSFEKLLSGYKKFKAEYGKSDASGSSVMEQLAIEGQSPEIMIVSCCDSRVDPAIILQCEPGDLFIARNVSNIIPPYENDEYHHGTSAALEFAICYLGIKHLIIWGHSSCGGLQALLNKQSIAKQNDFIGNWVDTIEHDHPADIDVDTFAKEALHISYKNCFSFPWIKSRVDDGKLSIHRWFFDIKSSELLAYDYDKDAYTRLENMLKY